jgi:hypothetical protein
MTPAPRHRERSAAIFLRREIATALAGLAMTGMGE